MPSIENISHEVDNWESLWLSYPKDQIPSTISDTIQVANPVSFRNIVTALRILGTLTNYKLHVRKSCFINTSFEILFAKYYDSEETKRLSIAIYSQEH